MWLRFHPGKSFPGIVILRIAQDVSSGVVKSVVDASASAGFPTLSFMVEEHG